MGSFHARVLCLLDEVAVAAVVEPRSDAGAALASEIGATAHASAEAVLDDPDIEAWLIATPTPSHPALVRRGLEQGLHVLCEKPLSLNPADDPVLEDLASSTDRVLQIGFWRRFSPPWAKAKRLIAAGAIGRPLMVRLAQWDADPPPPAFSTQR